MKRLLLGLVTLTAIVLSSCGGGEADCPDITIEDWDTFLGIDYGTNELALEEKIGNFTGGEYTSDSSAFIFASKATSFASWASFKEIFS